ncbi:hypothetical protein NP493_456g01027 [Ridgeia piscesae]|uniref:Uncharacterized protein n=1 Tax=Ridgeia piscesae TaxID=27915 RepID=A0AAD9L0G4_RIDPI|nr:hypothetical protein NP493_456g01027 [Ridgeia piscesae]
MLCCAPGVSTEQAWRTHLKKRWPHAALRSAPVFGEDEASADPHQKYLEKHCHDLLHCRFFVQHQHADPRGYFNTCLYRLNHSECRLPDADPSQLDHNDLYVYAKYMRRVTIRAVQCSAMLTDARLLDVWRSCVHCLNIHWVRDEYFSHLVALVAQLLQHGALDTLVLFHFHLSPRHIGQLFQLCAGHGPRCRLKSGPSVSGPGPDGPCFEPAPGPSSANDPGPTCSVDPGQMSSDHVFGCRVDLEYRSGSVNAVNIEHVNTEQTEHMNNEQTEHVNVQQTEHTNNEQTELVNMQQTEHTNNEQTEHVNMQQTEHTNNEQTEHVNVQQTEHSNNEQTEHVNTEQTEHMNNERTEHVNTEQAEHSNNSEQTEHGNRTQTEHGHLDAELTEPVSREQTEHVNRTQTEHGHLDAELTEPVNQEQTEHVNRTQTEHGHLDAELTEPVNQEQTEHVNRTQTEHGHLDAELTEPVSREQIEHTDRVDQTDQMDTQHTHEDGGTVPQGRSLREAANLALQGLISQNAPQPSEHTSLHTLHQMSDFDIDTDTDDLFDAAVLLTPSTGTLPLTWGCGTEGVNPSARCNTRSLGSLGIITSPHCSQLIKILVDILPRWQHLHRLALYSAFVGTDQFQEIILQKLDTSQLRELVMVDCIFSKSRILLDTLQVLVNSDRQKPIQHLLLNNNVETISTYADPMSFDIDGSTVDFLGVVELDLSDNRMDDACVAMLARLLRHDIALRQLKLDTCQMREGRLLHILRSMPDGGRLETLSLAEIIFSRETTLTAATEDELVSVLQKTRTLKFLNVQGCHLSARLVTSPAFIESIRQHPSLTELNVADNHLGE